jgi:uncharacterized ferritin-like protein (DUF455 family)
MYIYIFTYTHIYPHAYLHTYTHTHTHSYGELRGTETLWECAEATKDDVCARLCVINLVHEARGLDTSEGTIQVHTYTHTHTHK